MSQPSKRGGRPIQLTARSATALRLAIAAEITGGLWAGRRRLNREVSIPAGWNRLHQAGNFHDWSWLRVAVPAATSTTCRALDSDVYKWL